MKLLRLLLPFLSSALVLGCSPTTFMAEKSDVEIDRSGGGSSGGDSSADESADPPVNVTGTYLICSYIEEATDASPRADLGCVVRDQDTHAKVQLTQVAERWDWTYDITAADKKNVEIDVDDKKDSDPNWHAIYTFTGPSAKEVREVAALTSIEVPMVKKGEAEETTVFKGNVTTATDTAGGGIKNDDPSRNIADQGPPPTE